MEDRIEINGVWYIREEKVEELEIYTYLQKQYEDDKFLLVATFEDETDTKIDIIEFTDKRKFNSVKEWVPEVWDNDKWFYAVATGNHEAKSEVDKEILPILEQFLKQILRKK